MKTVPMHGPSISDPSKTVNRDVPENDVQAYRAAGYVDGYMVEEVKEDANERSPKESPKEEPKKKGKK